MGLFLRKLEPHPMKDSVFELTNAQRKGFQDKGEKWKVRRASDTDKALTMR